jgi:hypothetical protein
MRREPDLRSFAEGNAPAEHFQYHVPGMKLQDRRFRLPVAAQVTILWIGWTGTMGSGWGNMIRNVDQLHNKNIQTPQNESSMMFQELPNVAWLSRAMQRKKQPLSSLFFPSRARVAVDRARLPSRKLSRDCSFLWS